MLCVCLKTSSSTLNLQVKVIFSKGTLEFPLLIPVLKNNAYEFLIISLEVFLNIKSQRLGPKNIFYRKNFLLRKSLLKNKTFKSHV